MKFGIQNIIKAIILSIFFIGINVHAQQFKASVDKTTIGQNEKFQVYFEFSGGDYNKVKNFRAPNFEGLKVLSGPNQATSMQFINGQMSASITYSYIVVGVNLGTYKIESASIYYEDKVFNSEPISISIAKATGNLSAIPPAEFQMKNSQRMFLLERYRVRLEFIRVNRLQSHINFIQN